MTKNKIFKPMFLSKFVAAIQVEQCCQANLTSKPRKGQDHGHELLQWTWNLLHCLKSSDKTGWEMHIVFVRDIPSSCNKM